MVMLEHPEGMLLCLHRSPDPDLDLDLTWLGLGSAVAVLSFRVASRAELVLWETRLAELGVQYSGPRQAAMLDDASRTGSLSPADGPTARLALVMAMEAPTVRNHGPQRGPKALLAHQVATLSGSMGTWDRPMAPVLRKPLSILVSQY